MTRKDEPNIDELRARLVDKYRKPWAQTRAAEVIELKPKPDAECSQCFQPYVRAHGHPTEALCVACWNPEE